MLIVPMPTEKVAIFTNPIPEIKKPILLSPDSPKTPTTTPQAKATSPIKKIPEKIIIPPPPIVEPPKKSLPDQTFYTQGLESVVNILCSNARGNEYTIATGVIIDTKGYILSNAHVTDDLPKNPVCSIRRGSPARTFGTATLVFLPEAYKNASSEEQRARHDISIWRLDTTASGLSAWPIDTSTAIAPNDQLRTLSYPAELLGGETILTSLALVLSNTTVIETDQFIIQTSANLSAQHGSSGGVLVNPYTARAQGLIFAVGEGNTAERKYLYALTMRSVSETIANEKGKDIYMYLASLP